MDQAPQAHLASTEAIPQDRAVARLLIAALALLLVVEVPLFLCMPLGPDATLYDLAARAVLQGGIAYRDVFDTNLPGMLWLHLGVRAWCGGRSEMLRGVDLLIMTTALVLLCGRLPRSTRCERLLLGLLLASFYLGTSEGNHCQRDVWMLLPALLALRLRCHALPQAWRAPPLRASFTWMVGWSTIEGLCWGCAFWIKPFVLVPAICCWLGSLLIRGHAGRRDYLLADCLGLCVGGLLAGGTGVAWLWLSGSWPYFWEIMTQWNPEYARASVGISRRLTYALTWAGPWSLVHLVAAPVAVWILVVERTRAPRLLLATVYLGWLAQAVCLQHRHEYAQLPTILLAFAVLAPLLLIRCRPRFSRWAVGATLLLALSQSSLWCRDRLITWSQCWLDGSSAALKDRLKRCGDPAGADWSALVQVRDYLASRDLTDGDLACADNQAHVLYLELGLHPATPFVHFQQVLSVFTRHREELRQSLSASSPRLVVSDLLAVFPDRDAVQASGSECILPPQFPAAWRSCFPWSEPIVFRAGRYAVHRVTGPIDRLAPEVIRGRGRILKTAQS